MFKATASEAQIEQYKQRLQAGGKYLSLSVSAFSMTGDTRIVHVRRKHLCNLRSLTQSESINIYLSFQ